MKKWQRTFNLTISRCSSDITDGVPEQALEENLVMSNILKLIWTTR